MPGAYKNLSIVQTTAGSTQATAAAMVADVVMVVSANAGEGVIVPNGNALEERMVVNGTTVDICVYPPVGGKINNYTVNLPIVLAPSRSARLVGVNNVNWMAQL